MSVYSSPGLPKCSHGAVRRAIFNYVFAVIVTLQAVFVLVRVFGLDFDPAWMVYLVPGVIPLALAAWLTWAERRALEGFAVNPWWLWSAVGSAMFGFWAGGYFLVGMLTDPAAARILPAELERFDRFVDFDPTFVFLYLTVYPFFLLPFLRADTRSTIIRYALGSLVMLLISYVIFVIVPVAFPRPRLPDTWSSFSVWTLQIVYGRDPPWNCLPSTHCAVAMLAALALVETRRAPIATWAVVTSLAIAVSTVFTKQHYIVDALAGFALAAVIHVVLRWMWANPGMLPDPARQLVEETTKRLED